MIETNLKLTLDTNCLIDLDVKDRDQSPFMDRIRKLHLSGDLDVALGASSASEKQMSGQYLKSMDAFIGRANRLGFGRAELLPPLLHHDVGFWNNALWGSAEDEQREAQISNVLFPSREIEWRDYANARGVEESDRTSKENAKWLNELLDIKAYWAHEFANRNVFVTSDRAFKKLVGHPGFPTASVMTPAEVCEYL